MEFMAAFVRVEWKWRQYVADLPVSYKHGSLLKFQSTDLLAKSSNLVKGKWTDDIPTRLTSLITANLDGDDEELARVLSSIYAASKVLAYVYIPFQTANSAFTTAIKCVTARISSLMVDELESEYMIGSTRAILKSLAGHLMSQLITFAINSGEIDQLTDMSEMVMECMQMAGTNVPLLHAVGDYLSALREYVPTSPLLSLTQLQTVLSTLHENIGSFDACVRVETLRLLACFEQEKLPSSSNSQGPCKLFEHCLDMDRFPNDFDSARDKAIVLRRIDGLVQNGLPKGYVSFVVNYVVSLFAVNFAPLWIEVAKTLEVCWNSDPAAFWDVFYPAWEKVTHASADNTPKFAYIGEEIVARRTTKSTMKKIAFHCADIEDVEATCWSVIDRVSFPAKSLVHAFVEVHNPYIESERAC
jgi:hypothetical protein